MSNPQEDILVFIESNTTGTGELLGESTRKRGLRPVYLVASASNYPFLDRFDYIEVDTNSIEGAKRAIEDLRSAGNALRGITTTSEYFVFLVAQLARHYGLPGPSPDSVALCRDKYRLRQWLDANGLGTVRYRLARNKSDSLEALAALGAPVVVKPRGGSGSIAVMLCSSADDLEQAYEKYRQYRNAKAGNATHDGLLIEAFGGGREYSVEIFNGIVVGITEKYVSDPPVFVEIGHDYPANLLDSVSSRIASDVADIIRRIGLTWGAAHAEIKIDDDQLHIIEINPRLAGGMIPRLVSLASGIDLLEAQLDLVTGKPVTLAPTRQRFSAIRFIVANQNGRFVRRKCEQEWREPNELKFYFDGKHEVRLNGDFRDRIGHVIVSSEERESLLHHVERAFEMGKRCIEIEAN